MSMSTSALKYVERGDIPQRFDNGFAKGEMLPNAFPGAATNKCSLKAGVKVELKSYTDKIQVFFFAKGTGYIGGSKQAFNVTEAAFYIPMYDGERFFIQAATDMEFLELLVDITEEHKAMLDHMRMTLPRFKLLSNCDRYEEGFKGPGIKSYSLISRGTLGLILMGVVQGDGPDYVGEHSHEGVNQWLYALEGTKFTYTAAGQTITVQDGDCTYIPKQTPHSVTTEAGDKINYLWFEIMC